LDHTLAVLDVMGRHADRPVILIGPDDVTAVVPRGGVTLSLSVGDRVSILPLATAQVTATGLRWPVDYTAMAPLGFASPSNAAAATQVRVDADAPVLLILPRGRLANLAGAISSSGR
jgi:thiamine pyrophosphokinase